MPEFLRTVGLKVGPESYPGLNTAAVAFALATGRPVPAVAAIKHFLESLQQ
jgi:hypothetical protein